MKIRNTGLYKDVKGLQMSQRYIKPNNQMYATYISTEDMQMHHKRN
jgi:hypothetical protein